MRGNSKVFNPLKVIPFHPFFAQTLKIKSQVISLGEDKIRCCRQVNNKCESGGKPDAT